ELSVQSILTRHDVALHLLGEALGIALTNICSGLLDIDFGKTQRTKAFRSHQIGGFYRLSNLIVDARTDQLDGMSAVVASHQQSGLRKFVLYELHDLQCSFRVIDTNHDGIGRARTGVAQRIEPPTVAKKDLEPEPCSIADPVRVPVDNGKAYASRQQELRGDLTEAAKADNKYPPLEVAGNIDAIHRRFAAQQPVRRDYEERRQ